MARGVYTRGQEVNDVVEIRGDQYTVLRVEDVEHGKRRFVLKKNDDGSRFTAVGKRIQHNTIVTPAVSGQ